MVQTIGAPARVPKVDDAHYNGLGSDNKVEQVGQVTFVELLTETERG